MQVPQWLNQSKRQSGSALKRFPQAVEQTAVY